MRCYLSSHRVGDHPEALTALAPPPGPVALIGNAVDAGSDADARAASLAVDVAQLTALGYAVDELDLRAWFDRDGVAAELARYPVVYVRGGNVFVLREALARSRADAALRDLLARDAVVFAGYSAGPCVLAPSLRGLEHCDPPADVRAAYGADPRFDGLGVLDRAVVPHLDTPGHPETELLAEVAAGYDAAGLPYVALRDGDVLVIDGDRRVVLPRRPGRRLHHDM